MRVWHWLYLPLRLARNRIFVFFGGNGRKDICSRLGILKNDPTLILTKRYFCMKANERAKAITHYIVYLATHKPPRPFETAYPKRGIRLDEICRILWFLDFNSMSNTGCTMTGFEFGVLTPCKDIPKNVKNIIEKLQSQKKINLFGDVPEEYYEKTYVSLIFPDLSSLKEYEVCKIQRVFQHSY